MAEAFLRSSMTISASGRAPMRQTVMQQISAWIKHNNEVHPHKALGYRSP
jgi:putative transposase